MTLKLGIIGCGGMGLRHMHGISELMKYSEIMKLEAVCDLHESAANHVASKAEEISGNKPSVFTSLEKMLTESEIDVLDIVTDTRTHHKFAIEAMENGVHVMTEKPMGVTLKACRKMIESRKNNNVKLAVAENYRRDPMNRLVKELIENGVIGIPQMLLDISVSGGGKLMHATGWRAKKVMAGSLILEQGVHVSDLILYFMGDAETIYATTGIMQKERIVGKRPPGIEQFYGHRVEDQFEGQSKVIIDAEDTAFSVIKFESGAIGQMTLTNGANGYGFGNETIHGTEGTIQLPGSRNNMSESITGDDLLELVPNWELDDITSLYFDGNKRISNYDFPFEAVDRKLIAIEMHDLADAIINDSTPEVDEIVGVKALSLAYGALESGDTGQIVKLKDIETGKVNQYQSEIDIELEI
jgi:predicted dehydrogenase